MIVIASAHSVGQVISARHLAVKLVSLTPGELLERVPATRPSAFYGPAPLHEFTSRVIVKIDGTGDLPTGNASRRECCANEGGYPAGRTKYSCYTGLCRSGGEGHYLAGEGHPALIARYYGSKLELFETVLQHSLDVSMFTQVERHHSGEKVAAAFCKSEPGEASVIPMLVFAAGDSQARNAALGHAFPEANIKLIK